MNETFDFERAWLARLSHCLESHAGAEARDAVMRGSEALSSRSSREEIISWSRDAMNRLQETVDTETAQEIMSGCACHYPQAALLEIREIYRASGSIDSVQWELQDRFEALLRDTLGLSEDLVDQVVALGWGSAGVRQGNTITATKIPKSGNLIAYFDEDDPAKRRQLYCHCPRIRDVLSASETIPTIYCYCGAGFYKNIWEEILELPVKVEVLKSVLAGDDVCTIAVHLPPDSEWEATSPSPGSAHRAD